jgi:hypothetical protein
LLFSLDDLVQSDPDAFKRRLQLRRFGLPLARRHPIISGV